MSFELLEHTNPEVYGYDGSGISLDDIEFHEDKDVLVERLKQFFVQEVEEGLDPRFKMRKAHAKARSLIYGQYDEGKILSQYNYQKGRVKAIKDAISHGYIYNITVKKPWHPRIFLSDNHIYTYFLQHERVVLYSGQKKHIFFKEEGKQDLLENRTYDQFNNAGSILGQGFLAKDDSNRFTDERQTYYTTEPSNAGNYAGGDAPLYNKGVVLEVCVPRTLPRYQVKDKSHGTRPNISSIQQINDFFGSPKEHLPSYNNVEFHIRKRLPLDYIMRVWDVERHGEKPVFHPLNKYASMIKRDFPERVPALSQTNLKAPEPMSEPLENEISVTELLEDVEENYLSKGGVFLQIKFLLGNIEKNQEIIIGKIKDVLENSSGLSDNGRRYYDYDQTLDGIFSRVDEYNSRMEKLSNLLSKTGRDIQPSKATAEDLNDLQKLAAYNIKVFKETSDQIKLLEREVEQKEEDMRALKRDIMKSNVPSQKAEKMVNSFKSLEQAEPDKLAEKLKIIDLDKSKIRDSVKNSKVEFRDEIRSEQAAIKKTIEGIEHIRKMEEALIKAESVIKKGGRPVGSQDQYLSLYSTLEKYQSSSGELRFSYSLREALLDVGVISTRGKFNERDKVTVDSGRKLIQVIERYKDLIESNWETISGEEENLQNDLEKLEELNKEIISKDEFGGNQELLQEVEEEKERIQSDREKIRSFLGKFRRIVLKKDSILGSQKQGRKGVT